MIAFNHFLKALPEGYQVHPYKAAFQERNRAMIERSNLAVFAVSKSKGGAYFTMKYATAQGIDSFNLLDCLD